MLEIPNRPWAIADRGSDKPCPNCGLAQANQHSLRESAICDGLRKGHIDPLKGKLAIQQRCSVKRIKV